MNASTNASAQMSQILGKRMNECMNIVTITFASFLVGLGIVLKEPYKHKFSRGLKSPDTVPASLLLNGTGANSEQKYQQNPRRFSPATCHLPMHADPGTLVLLRRAFQISSNMVSVLHSSRN
jgi:hypothetical protein